MTTARTQVFDQAALYLIEHQILLPGLSVLSRLVRQARREENARLHTHLVGRIPTTVHADLLDLLRVHDDARFSELERLRTEPDRVSSPGMVEALDRTSLIAGIGAGKVEVDDVPQAKLEALARYGMRAKAPSLADLTPDRQATTLLATTTRVVSLAEVWNAIEEVVPRAKLMEAVKTIAEQVPEDADKAAEWRARLVKRFRTVQGFIELLVEVIDFDAVEAGQPVLAGPAHRGGDGAQPQAPQGGRHRLRRRHALRRPLAEPARTGQPQVLRAAQTRRALARKICFGNRGELRQRYHQGLEDQFGALGPVFNAVVWWNSLYIDAAVTRLRSEGFRATDQMRARLSPLGLDHINFLGSYAFPTDPAVEDPRPLRDPHG